MEQALLLVAAGLGYVASSMQQWLSDRRLELREDRARTVARDESRQDRRETFQRETLLSLQDAVARLSRATGAMHAEDIVHHRSTGEPYGWQRTSSEWNEKHNAAVIDVRTLVVRVTDEPLRENVDNWFAPTTAVVMSSSEDEARTYLGIAVEAGDVVHERIGQLLREVY